MVSRETLRRYATRRSETNKQMERSLIPVSERVGVGEGRKLRVFENKVLSKIFDAKRDEVTGEWRKLHNAELQALYSSLDIIRNNKSRCLSWAGHIASMGESRNAYRMLVGRPEGKRPLGSPRRRWEDNIKMDMREVEYDDRDWINLAQDRDRWQAYVRAAESCFPQQWKKSNIVAIIKPGKEEVKDVSKYRPISLLNVAGKVLDKLMINRILHHVHTNTAGLNRNQYGFMPQKGTVDALIAAKEIIEENLSENNCIAVVSLDVRGAFDAAWWPGILYNLRELKCPKNLFNLARSYFSNRIAALGTNTFKIERPVTMGCPQGSCSGPGFWNILYNSLLNLDFTHRTRVIAFADDLMVLTQGKPLRMQRIMPT
ncbi:hypothetical protein ANN_23264 [Periplaneta americana]|uniref:Reverse transcriptase domain-containing protein n=1 Tax=Periplaneta americana TaxID=6978 RepID=A0ABQ8SKN7_PERAM|nr:hypothetical protein ANN_23264 [Periplaneta americana]